MSRGKNLQEMEAGTKQSKTAVNANAAAAEPMAHLTTGIPDGQSATGWEDLGGPTPENYKSDDDSSKLKEPSLKTVSDVVTKGAKSADVMKKLAVKEDEDLEEEDLLDEEDEIEEVAEAKNKENGESEEEDEEEDEDDDDEDEKVKEELTFDVEEDVNALIHGEELSEEFQEKARIIFESALRSKVEEIRESFEEHYEQRLIEEVEEIKSDLQERVDAYLEYVASEWMTENTLAVETGLKEELTESFMTGLKGLFEDHYVSIPEDKYDVLESMVEKLDEMETKLNEQIEKNISLNKRLSESVADRIFDEISEGLALSQKDKLASLAESVEFESETTYREKLETLKESYFPSRVVAPQATTETLSEGVEVATEYHSDSMNAYLRTLSAVAKR
jgi:hypothetical protein